jgi:hypothetical protein
MTILKKCVYALEVLYVLLNLYYFVGIPNAAYGGSLLGSLLVSAFLYLLAKKGADFYALHKRTFRGYLVAGIVAFFGLLECEAILQLVTPAQDIRLEINP